MSSNSTFYTGVWINHSKGPVLGATLTVSPRAGLVLVAVLALFVSLTGSQSWAIMKFVLHQWRVPERPETALYHQQQAIIRNTAIDSATLWQLGRMSWFWRFRGVNSFRKSFGLILLALVHLILFTVAGILSSSLARFSGNEVLVRSTTCGPWNDPEEYDLQSENGQKSFALETAYYAHAQRNGELSKDYVRGCLNGYHASPQCNLYKRSRLPYVIDRKAPCPFSLKMCLGPPNSSVTFDTGLIDSREDLGVNSRQAHRVLFRKTMSCSPLATDGYIVSGNEIRDGRLVHTAAAFYGRNNWMESSHLANVTNATYVHSDYKVLATGYDLDKVNEIYSVASFTAYESSPDWGFTAIPELFSPTGQTALVFASSQAFYLKPSDDLWLSAHRPSNATAIGALFRQNYTFYTIDKNISVLGCLEQYQLCNPNAPQNSSKRCTPQSGIIQLEALNMSDYFDNNRQLIITDSMMPAGAASAIETVVHTAASPLLATEYLMNSISNPLPADHWISEITNWFEIGLNMIQRYTAEYATGPGEHGNATADVDIDSQWYCNNFILRDGGYTSFSVLAIGLIIGFGGFIIILSLFFETLVGWLQSRWKRGLLRKTYWNLDSALQLQRMAFEEAGLGTWENCAHDIPVTSKGEKIRLATEWDEWHPSIVGKEALVKPSLHPKVAEGEIQDFVPESLAQNCSVEQGDEALETGEEVAGEESDTSPPRVPEPEEQHALDGALVERGGE